MSRTRRVFSKDFKSKVVLDALRERETIEVLAKKHELLPTQISLLESRGNKKYFFNFFGRPIGSKKGRCFGRKTFCQDRQVRNGE